MKPGKPTVIGIIETESSGTEEKASGKKQSTVGLRKKLVVGLPGHPMAAIVAYDVIVNDFIRRHCFHNEEEPIRLTARITENIHAGEGRETYQLVTLKRADSESRIGEYADSENRTGYAGQPEWIAEPIHAKSGSISQLMLADGYVKIPSLSEGVKVNCSVEVTLIGR